jgi:hypothetical protein
MLATRISPTAARLISGLMLLAAAATAHAQPVAPAKNPILSPDQAIAIEAEDMHGVTEGASGIAGGATTPGGGWKFARWGTDLLQNNTFGGHWSSRMANAIADATSPTSAQEIYQNITISKAGHYKVWAKFECPPFFNYPFGIKIVKLENGKPTTTVFDKTYGLRKDPKHFSFSDKLITGDLYWSWGMDHDAGQGFETDLPEGEFRVILYKAPNVDDSGPRSVDAIMITPKITDILSPDNSRFPMLNDLVKLNHCYFRFTNTGNTPVKVTYNHWAHRYDNFYNMGPAASIRFYNEDGSVINGADGKPLSIPNGIWNKPLAPGESTPWIDLGPTMTTENSSPVNAMAIPLNEKGNASVPTGSASAPLRMDIALEPGTKNVVKTFEKGPADYELGVIVMPDLHRQEGLAYTMTVVDGYKEFTRKLNTLPTVGPMPSKLRFIGFVGSPIVGAPIDASSNAFAPTLEYNIALGLNTVSFQANQTKQWNDTRDYYKSKNIPFIYYGAHFQHTKDPEYFKRVLYKPDPTDPKKFTDELYEGVKDRLRYVSFGDEIGIPGVDIKNPATVAKFREFLKANKVDPKLLGVDSLDKAIPLNGFTPAELAGVGIVPPKDAAGKDVIPTGPDAAKFKALFWWTHQFAIIEGCLEFADITKKMTAMVNPEFKTTANLGGMHPFYWMHQSSFIEAFRHKGMTLAWSEDYDYCQPEGSRLVIGFQGAYLRAGAKYHDTPMMFYVMPHYPGNSGRHLFNNVITLWGQGIKDIDWFSVPIDGWTTENYLHTRGGVETGRVMRVTSGMAGNVENDLMAAKVRPARVAMLLSEASDLWEVEGYGQYKVEPGSTATNAYQEERKAIWYALKKAGYQVDLLTENDVAEGRLKPYKAIYLGGQNLDSRCVAPIQNWVKDGGNIILLQGAARKDQYDQPLTALDSLVGRTTEVKSLQPFKGPLRSKLELPFTPSLGKVTVGSASFDARVTREDFVPAKGVQTIATFDGAGPAAVTVKTGQGSGTYIATLPGQAMLFAGIPKRAQGKGGPDNNPVHFEPETLDPAATALILAPLNNAGIKPDVITGSPMILADILDGPTSTVLTVNRLSNPPAGWKPGAIGEAGKTIAYVLDPAWPTAKNVKIIVPGLAKPSKVFTALKAQGVTAEPSPEGLVITLPELDAGDVVVLQK